MGRQPIACFPDDPVEDALEFMEAAGMHRLYITGANREDDIGTLAYAEIVGLLRRPGAFRCRTLSFGFMPGLHCRTPADKLVSLARLSVE
jgi:CBS domain-containing protein